MVKDNCTKAKGSKDNFTMVNDNCTMVKDNCTMVKDNCTLVKDNCTMVKDNCTVVRTARKWPMTLTAKIPGEN